MHVIFFFELKKTGANEEQNRLRGGHGQHDRLMPGMGANELESIAQEGLEESTYISEQKVVKRPIDEIEF